MLKKKSHSWRKMEAAARHRNDGDNCFDALSLSVNKTTERLRATKHIKVNKDSQELHRIQISLSRIITFGLTVSVVLFITNLGYFSNSLTRECVPCSFCFPDHPGLTLPVKQCAVRGQPVLYRCLPVIHRPPPPPPITTPPPAARAKERRRRRDRRRLRRRRRRQRAGKAARERDVEHGNTTERTTVATTDLTETVAT